MLYVLLYNGYSIRMNVYKVQVHNRLDIMNSLLAMYIKYYNVLFYCSIWTQQTKLMSKIVKHSCEYIKRVPLITNL